MFAIGYITGCIVTGLSALIVTYIIYYEDDEDDKPKNTNQ